MPPKKNRPHFSWKYNPNNIDKKRAADRARTDNKRQRLLNNADIPDNIPSPINNSQELEDLGNINIENAIMQADSTMEVEAAGPSGAGTGDTSTNAAMSSANGGGSSVAMRGTAILPAGIVTNQNNEIRTFKKQYHLKLRYSPVQYAKENNFARGYVRFPVYEFPWEYLGFYLTADEIHQLFATYTQVKVDTVRVSISNYTAILNFDTGSSVAAVGNNNVGFRASIMNNMRGTRSGFYTQNPADTVGNIFWGQHATQLPNSPAFTDVMPNMGASYLARNYELKFNHEFQAVQNQFLGQSLVQYNRHWFNWLAYFQNRRNVSMNEGLWHVQEHKVNQIVHSKNILVNHNFNLAATFIDQNPVFFNENIGNMSITRPVINHAGNNSNDGQRAAPMIGQTIPINFNHQFVLPGASGDNATLGGTNNITMNPAIRNNNSNFYKYIRLDTKIYKENLNESNECGVMPTLAIGLEPMMTSSGETNSFIDGWIQIVIDCECDVSLTGNPNYHFPQGGSGAFPTHFPPPQNFNPVYNYNQAPRNDSGPTDTITNVSWPSHQPIERATRHVPLNQLYSNSVPGGISDSGQANPNPIFEATQITSNIITRSKAKAAKDDETKKVIPLEKDEATDIESIAEDDSSEEEQPTVMNENNKLKKIINKRLTK